MKMQTRYAAIGTLTLFLVGLALFAPGTAARRAGEPGRRAARASRPTLVITIDNFTFGRKEVTVDRRTTITWLNRDDMPHTVVSTDRSFQSPPLDTGDRFSQAFDKPGTYDYFCSIHPHMTGRVVVR